MLHNIEKILLLNTSEALLTASLNWKVELTALRPISSAALFFYVLYI